MKQAVQQNMGTWQVWEEEVSNRRHLRVQGEIPAFGQEPGVRLVKAASQPEDGRQLHLQIVPGVLTENPDRMLELTYNETLNRKDQYSSVVISADGKIIAQINAIGEKETR